MFRCRVFDHLKPSLPTVSVKGLWTCVSSTCIGSLKKCFVRLQINQDCYQKNLIPNNVPTIDLIELVTQAKIINREGAMKILLAENSVEIAKNVHSEEYNKGNPAA